MIRVACLCLASIALPAAALPAQSPAARAEPPSKPTCRDAAGNPAPCPSSTSKPKVMTPAEAAVCKDAMRKEYKCAPTGSNHPM